VASPERFWFDTDGRDVDALRDGFAWLTQRALGGRGIIAIPTLEQVDSLVPGITRDDADELRNERRLRRAAATLELVTQRTFRTAPMRAAPVLGVWLDDDHLEAIERKSPSALCVIPWRPADISRWRDAYGPTDLRSGRTAPTKSLVSNLVVEEALKSLAPWGLAHPSDKRKAVWAFRHLFEAGEGYDPEEVVAWAANNGWSMADARELGAIARGVAAGKQYRVQGSPYPANIVQQWRDAAAGR
jgi:hypothetical protein